MQAISLKEKENKEISILSIKLSAPISIPISISRNNLENILIEDQYSLKSNIFDPGKMSPPDKWNYRLKKRLNNYNSFKEDFNK